MSDIALDWMVEELGDCVLGVRINDGMLNRFPDPKGLQHREDTVFRGDQPFAVRGAAWS